MRPITRRQSLRVVLASASAGVVVVGFPRAARAEVAVSFDRPMSLRLNLDCTQTRDNGKIKFRAHTQDPVTKRHMQTATWGHFTTIKSYTKPINLAPGPYWFNWSGGGVRFSVTIEAKPVARDEQWDDYKQVGKLAGNAP